jgi:drug/metabolite transporter (DMT)-like permease
VRPVYDVLLLLVALLWSSSGLLIKLVSLHPLAIAGFRSAVTAVFLVVMTRGRGLGFGRFQLACTGVYAFTVITFVVATRLTTAANAILLQYSAPVYVAVLGGWLLGEDPDRGDWLALVLVLCGLVLFFFDELTTAGMWGNVLAIASGAGWAWVHLLLRRQKDADPVSSLTMGNALAALICLPWMLRGVPGGRDWLILLFLGVVQLGLANLIYGRVIRHVRAIDAILILTAEPVFNPVWVYLVVGERPGNWALAGGAIVVVVICWRSLRRMRPVS